MKACHKAALNITGAGLALGAIGLYIKYPTVMGRLCREDGILESLSVIFYLAASGIFVHISRKQNWKNIWSWGLALLFFVVAAEEISWGQRFFGIESPAVLKELNVQQETNLHNLAFLDNKIRAIAVLVILGFCYFIPVTNRFSAPLLSLYAHRKIPIYPLWNISLPTLALLFMLVPRLLWHEADFYFDELGEFFLSGGFLLFALSQYKKISIQPAANIDGAAPELYHDPHHLRRMKSTNERMPIAVIFLSLANWAYGQTTVVVDGNTTYQTISGWGGNTYSWVINGWNGWTDNQVFDVAFDKLKTTHVRMVTEFDGWEPANDDDNPEHFNWSYYQSRFAGADISSQLVQGDFKMMDKVAKEFDDHLIVGIWDVPNWMAVDSTQNDHRNLPYRMHREFAESVAAYLLWARDHRGINIGGIVIANEPDGHNVKHSPIELRDLIKTVGAKFAREGIQTKIIAPDLSSPYYDPDEWVIPLLADSVAASYLGAISYHTYYTSGSPDKWNKKFAHIAQLAASKNLPVYFTEIGTMPFNVPNTTWPWAFDCIQMWHNTLTYGNASLGFQWALLGKDQVVNPALTRNHIYYALKQYFAHVRAGAVRIAAGSASDDLLVSAFKHPGSNRAQIVLINRSILSQSVTVELYNLNVPTFAACRTSATEKHKLVDNLTVVNGKLNITIPANAVVTLDGAIMFSLNPILETHDAPLPPMAFNLQAYPNPFHKATRIHFALPQAAEVDVAIFDLAGREVQELTAAVLAAGNHVVVWDRKNRAGNNLNSGIYLVRLRCRSASTKAWSQAVQRVIMMN